MKPTTEDVLKWAREAGFYPENAPAMNPILEKLAALAYAAGAAAEREEIAKEAERNGNSILAMQLRARGEKNE